MKRKSNLQRVHLMLLLSLIAIAGLAVSPQVAAFCGFYVAKADSKLFNEASQVAIVRDGDRTVLTMSNDFQGDMKEFAIVIPVPTKLERGQIHIADRALMEHLDAYTSPRLVEYFDGDPCAQYRTYNSGRVGDVVYFDERIKFNVAKAQSLGVTIEAQYTIGEYDILILSAKESSGLETWLKQSGYKIPDGASDVLGSYIRQDMRFFVAKVNLTEQSKLGYTYLRPIQVAYESPKFMLPIRLGMLNANGSQELFVYALTRTGRVETTNYRTVKLASGQEIPVYVKDEFGEFYKDMFAQQVKKEDNRAVFLEYAWDMNFCDPCAADPFTKDELRELGVFWQQDGQRRRGKSQAQNVYVTRLHVRYDKDHFPEDLFFQATSNRQNFQGRYVIRHQWTGTTECEQGKAYIRNLIVRQEKEAQTLANLTGWDVNEIRLKMDIPKQPVKDSWWKRIWKG